MEQRTIPVLGRGPRARQVSQFLVRWPNLGSGGRAISAKKRTGNGVRWGGVKLGPKGGERERKGGRMGRAAGMVLLGQEGKGRGSESLIIVNCRDVQ